MSDDQKEEKMNILEHLRDDELLARVIWGEARGEPVEGQIAVGCVIRNRVRNPSWWGDDWKSVMLKPYQFSCLNVNDPNREKLKDLGLHSDPVARQCLYVARGIITDMILDNTAGANHYVHCRWVDRTSWAKGRDPVQKINNHWFYKI